MTTETKTSSNGFLYFIVGALVIAVIAFGVIYFQGGLNQSPTERAITNAADSVAGAAEEVSESASN